jgi:gag-polypeptide of LTR copia-type/Zinc knuckle
MDDEGIGMQEHINHFTWLDQSLKAIGLELPDMLRMTVLLASLHHSYENLVTVIESHIETQIQPSADADLNSEGMTGPDFDYVTHRLLNEERRRRMETEGVGSTSAYVVRTSKKHVKCFRCRKMGHYKSDCLEAGGDQNKDKASVAQN